MPCLPRTCRFLCISLHFCGSCSSILMPPGMPRGKKGEKRILCISKKVLVYLIAFLREPLQHPQALGHASVSILEVDLRECVD